VIAPAPTAPPVRPVRRADGRVEVRCAACGYGAVVTRLPKRCPMCGGAGWLARR